MTPREQIFNLLEQLNLPKDQYIVFGSGIMAARNLRKIGDLDIFARRELYDKLLASGEYVEQVPNPNHPPFLEKTLEGIKVHVFYDWKKTDTVQIIVEDLLDKPVFVKDYPFTPLKMILDWKKVVARKKDEKDITLIEQYFNKFKKNKAN